MSQEVIIFIIGSSFGFLLSISATVMNHIFQSKRDERDRKWVLEDKARQRHNEIYQIRFNQAEEYANLHLVTAIEMSEFELEIIKASIPKEFNKYAELKLIDFRDLQKGIAKLTSSVYAIRNENLDALSMILNKTVGSEFKRVIELLNRKKGEEDFDFETETQRLKKFADSIKKSHKEFISELDKLSISGE